MGLLLATGSAASTSRDSDLFDQAKGLICSDLRAMDRLVAIARLSTNGFGPLGIRRKPTDRVGQSLDWARGIRDLDVRAGLEAPFPVVKGDRCGAVREAVGELDRESADGEARDDRRPGGRRARTRRCPSARCRTPP